MKARGYIPWWSWLLLCVGMSGMALPALLPDATPPDPNDPLQTTENPAKIARKNLTQLFWMLDERRLKKEVTSEQMQALIEQSASEIGEKIEARGVRPAESFDVGEIWRTAKNWKKAAACFEASVKYYGGRNEDLWVNSLLRLAHCEAEMGEHDAALMHTKDSFAVSKGNKPPILLAVYLEIVPAMVRNNQTKGAPELVEEAMRQHSEAVVDPASNSGQVFLSTRAYHLSHAARLAATLYAEQGNLPAEKRLAELTKKLTDQAGLAVNRPN